MIIQWAKDCSAPLGGFRDGRRSSQSYHGISCQRGRWEPIESSRMLRYKIVGVQKWQVAVEFRFLEHLISIQYAFLFKLFFDYMNI